MDRREFPAGHFIFREGDSAGELFMLITGGVEVTLAGQVVARISEGGAILGEMSLLLGLPRTATVQTTAPSEFLVIHDLNTLVETQPALLVRIASQLAHRLKSMDEQFVHLRKSLEAAPRPVLPGS